MAQPALPDTVEAFEIALRSWMARYRGGQAVMAVSYRNRLVLARGYGGATPGTRMHIASLSKAITAACAATLIQDGKLAFDSKLEEILPDHFRAPVEPQDKRIRSITVEQLLTNRAGFGSEKRDPFSETLVNLTRVKAGAAITPDDILQGILKEKLTRAPGEAYRYSNAGYHVLGMVIERVSGRPYAEQCAQAVLEPIGVRNAQLSPAQYLRGAAGGWMLSGPEYLAFFRIFDPGIDAILSPATQRWMLSSDGKWMETSPGYFYSLGVFIQPIRPGEFVIGHTGGYSVNDGAKNGAALSYGAVVNRTETGVSWFAAYQPFYSIEARHELSRELRRAADAVRRWPDDDLFPDFGLK